MIALIFDFETTGLVFHPRAKDALQPSAIEFGGVLIDFDGTVIKEVSLLMNPGKPLEAIITKITGLTDADLEGKPTFDECADEIAAAFAMCDVAIAHNAPFDISILQLELQRVGRFHDFPFPKSIICTVQENVEHYGKRITLKKLYENVIGKPLEQTHRASDDCRALAEVVVQMGLLKGYEDQLRSVQ